MKKRLTALFLVFALVFALLPAVALPASAETYSGKCGDKLTWTLDIETGALAITGTGPMYDTYWHTPSDISWGAFRGFITSVSIGDGVTSIGDGAFYGCTVLTSVIIADSVTSIGNGAFVRCIELTNITIPNSVTSIGESAFSNCTGLTSVTIPGSVTSIGAYAFGHCKALASVTIPNSVTSISNSAFYGCTGLISMTIPNSVTSIGAFAFCDCTALTCVTIPNSVTGIGDSAFHGCTNLTSVTIPDSVASISEYALGYYGELDNDEHIKIDDFLIYGYQDSTAQNYAEKNGLTFIALEDAPPHNYSGTCGVNVFWELDTETGVLTISGTGAMENYIGSDYQFAPWNDQDNPLRDSIKTVIIEDGVTSIGAQAFIYCGALTSITIPSSVTSIGYLAFYHCDALTAVHVSDPAAWCNIDFMGYHEVDRYYNSPTDNPLYYAHNLYSNGTLVTALEVPDSITSINDYAFTGCTSLTSVTIPDSVTSIGGESFADCTALTRITIANDLAEVANNAFNNTGYYNNASNWTNDVLYIGNHLIRAKESISGSCAIKDGTKAISALAFHDCTELSSVIIPDSVVEIGLGAFYGCKSMNRITLPFIAGQHLGYLFATVHDPQTGSVDEFWWTEEPYRVVPSSLNAVEISDSCKCIDASAFAGCAGLASVTIGNGVTSIGREAFSGCTGLTSVTIGSSVTDIGNEAFSYCGLTSITIPDSVTSIGDSAFYGCTGLPSITIPDSVTFVDMYAFSRCTGLTSVTIGNGLRGIWPGVFSDCSGLTSVTIPVSVKWIDGDAFSGCTGLTDVYYSGSAEEWNSIADYYIECLTNANIHFGVPSGTCGENMFWALDAETGVLTISGTGAMENWAKGTHPQWYDYRDSIKSVVIDSGVTTVGDRAFQHLEEMTSVTIPDSVTSIGEYAFSYCPALTDVSIPDSVTSIGEYAFIQCTGLESIVIPSGVTTISKDMFYDCTSLTSVTIPHSVTSIEVNAFHGCTALTEVYYSGSILEWNAITMGESNDCLTNANIHFGIPSGACGENVFWVLDTETGELIITGTGKMENWAKGEHPQWYDYRDSITTVTVGNGVTTVGDRAFQHLEEMTSVTIPDSVTSIGEYACSYCPALTGISIPDGVTRIGEYAFIQCTGLKSVTISDSVTSIGKDAFYDCTALTSVTVPDSVTSIGINAFHGCTALAEITLPFVGGSASENTCFGYIFGASSYSQNSTYVPASLKAIVLGNNCVSIDAHAFCNCAGIESITIPGSVTAIGDAAFSGCTGLADVYYAESMVEWGLIAIGEENECLTGATIHFAKTHVHSFKSTVVAPTCTEKGYTLYTCTVVGCGYTEKSSWTNALGHDFVDGVCTRCGAEDPDYTEPTEAVAPGDLNGDGDVDAVDSIRLAKYLVGLVELTDEQIAAADVNGDGEVTATDAIRLAKYLVGLIDTLRPEPAKAAPAPRHDEPQGFIHTSGIRYRKP